MRNIVFSLVALALLVTASSAVTLKMGQGVLVCQDGEMYSLVGGPEDCGGTMHEGTVVESKDGGATVVLKNGNTITLPVDH